MIKISTDLLCPIETLSPGAWEILKLEGAAFQAHAEKDVWSPRTHEDQLGIIVSGLVNLRYKVGEQVFRTSIFRKRNSLLRSADFCPGDEADYALVAVRDGTQILYISNSILPRLGREDESFSRFLLDSLSDRANQLCATMQILSEPKATMRVAKFLHRLWEQYGIIKFSQREIARELGLSRVSVANALAELKAENLIAGSGRALRIENTVTLRDWVGV